MRAAVIAYTVNGAILAEKLRHLSDDETDICQCKIGKIY